MTARSDVGRTVPAAEGARPPHGWLGRPQSEVLILLGCAGILFAATILTFPLPPVVHDAYAYTMTALRLLQDHVFAYSGDGPGTAIAPNASVTPAHPLLLAAIYSLDRVRLADPIASIVKMTPFIVFVQWLMAIFIVFCAERMGRLLGGRRLALTAGAFAALYLPFAWAATVPLAEQAGTAAFAGLLWLTLELASPASPRRTWPVATGFGLLAAVTAMFRPALIAWPVFLLAYLLIRRVDTWARLIRFSAVAAVVFLLVFAPWWIRNLSVVGRFVPIRTDETVLAPVEPIGPPLELTTSEPIRGWPRDMVELSKGQASTRPPGAVQVLESISRPWVPPLADVWEDTFHPDERRVGFGQPWTYSPGLFVAGVRFAYVFQWVVLAGALLSLVFVRRSPRILLLASVPLYVIWAHYGVQVTPRYLYPAMPALVVMAACGTFAAARELGLLPHGSARPTG